MVFSQESDPLGEFPESGTADVFFSLILPSGKGEGYEPQSGFGTFGELDLPIGIVVHPSGKTGRFVHGTVDCRIHVTSSMRQVLIVTDNA